MCLKPDSFWHNCVRKVELVFNNSCKVSSRGRAFAILVKIFSFSQFSNFATFSAWPATANLEILVLNSVLK